MEQTMNTTIEIKNKYKMTLWEALAVMADNPAMEMEYNGCTYRMNNESCLQCKTISGSWVSCTYSITCLYGYWYPVYPEGTSDWARVQLEKGLIIENISSNCKIIKRLFNNEFQFRYSHTNWEKDTDYKCIDYYFVLYYNSRFKVVDDYPPLPDPEPEMGTLEWAKIELEKPMPEGYGLTWGSRAIYYRKNGDYYQKMAHSTNYEWKECTNPLKSTASKEGFVIEKLPIKKPQKDSVDIETVKGWLRVVFAEEDVLIRSAAVGQLREWVKESE